MGNKRYLLVVGCAAALAAPGIAAAQSGSEGIETVVVTAQKHAENIQNVPISIKAFTQKELSDLGIKASSDIGQVTPNVDVALPAGAGNQPIITIRGIGLNDYDTNNAGPNGIYVNEVYQSSPAAQTFQMFDINRVEVLKGPQGTLYGRNTSGGAINFITNGPSDDTNGYVHAEAGSYDTVNLEAAVGGPLSDTLDGRIAILKNYSSGYMHNDFTGTMANGANNSAGRIALQYKPTSQLTVLWNIHAGDVANRPIEYRHIGDLNPATLAQCSVAQTRAGGCVDLFGYGTPKNFYEGSYNRNLHLDVAAYGTYVRGDYQLGDITLTSISAFDDISKLHPEDSDASPNRLLEINFGVRSDTFTQEFRASQTTDVYNWVFGVYYLYENLRQNQPIFILLDIDKIFGPGAGNGVAFQAFDTSDQITDAYAAYGQAQYKILPKLQLTLGGRYTTERKGFHYDGSVQFQDNGINNFGPLQTLADVNNRLSDSDFNWRTALDYHLTDDFLAYASAATGFKSGDFNGSFLSLVPAQIERQLQPVGPEHVTAFEAGVKSTWFDDRLLLDAAGFYNDYRDMQVFVLVNTGGLPVNVLDNAKKAHTEGVEFQATAEPFSNFTANLDFGWLETRLDSFVANVDPTQPNYSGKQLPLSPHLSATTTLDYRIPIASDALDLQFSASYKGHQYFDVSNDPYTTQSPYWLENVRVAYDLGDTGWEFAGYVHNLSDQHYFVDMFDLTSPFGFLQGIEGMPRMYGFEVNYKF